MVYVLCLPRKAQLTIQWLRQGEHILLIAYLRYNREAVGRLMKAVDAAPTSGQYGVDHLLLA